MHEEPATPGRATASGPTDGAGSVPPGRGFVRDLRTCRTGDLAEVGGKAVGLGELAAAGAPVAEGVVVTTAAYRAAIEPVRSRLEALLSELERTEAQTPGPAHPEAKRPEAKRPEANRPEANRPDGDAHAGGPPVERARRTTGPTAGATSPASATADRIRHLVLDAAVPPALTAELSAAVERLGGPFAVRSSATAEDLADASFAGQQDTFLGVDAADVPNAVRRCWASLWTDRAIDYRRRHGIDPNDVSLAVVVQRLVPAVAAGVVFTADPSTGRRDRSVVSAAWGLGEAVVSAQVQTDDLVVGDGRVLDRRTGDKAVRTVCTADGTALEPVPDDRRRAPVLSDARALELVALAERVARDRGRPQDIEWALDGSGRIVLVQARPITALPPAPGPVPTTWPVHEPGTMYVRASIVEQMPAPLSPLFADLVATAVPEGLRRMIADSTGRLDVIEPDGMTFPTVNGYAYYAYTAAQLWRMMALLPAVLRTTRSARTTPDPPGVERWRTVAHPAYAAVAARANETDPATQDARALVALVDELVLACCEYYASVQEVLPSVAMAETLFTWFVRAVGRPGDPAPDVFLLGGDSAPIRAERDLFELARWVRGHDDLRRVVAAVDALPPDGARPEGVSAEDWAAFTERFRAHLARYGHAVFDLDLMNPVAADDPAPVLDSLRYSVRGGGKDPRERREHLRSVADEAAATVRRRLRPMLRRPFDRYLERARRLGPVHEDALADVGLAWPAARRALRTLGQRLTEAGAIVEPDDVYWLRRDELARAAADLDAGRTPPERRALVAERRTVWRGQALATPPGILPDHSIWHVFDRVMPTVGTDDGATLRGTASSGGIVTATSRVVHGPADFAALLPGEVLVAAITTPAWTPLFARAAGVVTDVGGPPSHSSIVAREYGVPAVLGTGTATSRIRTGDRITVDGRSGSVSWASDEESVPASPEERVGDAAAPSVDPTTRRRRAVLVVAGGVLAAGALIGIVAAVRSASRPR